MLSKGTLDCDGFQLVADIGGRAMRIDVADLLRLDLCICQGVQHYSIGTVAIFSRLGDVVRIEETRPMSKLKRWRLLDIIRRSALAAAADAEHKAEKKEKREQKAS